MKRLLTSVAMFLCSLLTFAQFSGSGSGTKNDPYLILNPIHLNQLRHFLKKNDVYFKMMADIDLTEFIEDEYPNKGWLPIGSESSSFDGILDGNGKTITGLTIDRDNNTGFFGYNRGVIKNLTLKNVYVKGTNNVGSLVGKGENMKISNCYVEGKIIGVNNVGGFVGSTTGGNYFKDLTASINVTATENNVGGLCGIGGGNEISNCKVINSYISGIDFVGGLSGSSQSISNSSFDGVVYGHSYVGGLTAYGTCDISKSHAYGDIQASGDYIGGIVGYCHGFQHSQHWENDILFLNNCHFSGNLSGENYVGGIAGRFTTGTRYTKIGIKTCFSNAIIRGEDYVGGICGDFYLSDTWSYMYLQDNVSSSSRISARGINNPQKTPSIGLIYGGNHGGGLSVSNNKSFNRAIVISQGIAIDVDDNEKNGTGVSTSTLKLKATYVAMGWDFTDTWEIQETECYPYFKIQTAPPVITSQVVSGATTISGKCIDGGTVTLEVDGVKQQMVSSGNAFSFNVSPLQAGHEVRICAKAEGKEQSYYTTETVTYLGSGKENDPYQVYTASDLTGVYRKGYFKLMNDIDLTDYINQFSPTEGWQSIGRDGSESIHFDGNGHKITGLWCNSTRDNTGLFSCFANGTIKNLTVETAKSKQVKGGANTGILIGKMINGTIENCKVSGTVADGTPVGGIIGLMDGGTIKLSQASVTIKTTEANTYIGGLVGEITSGEIDQCVTTGFYTAEGTDSYVGGLVGKNSATITNSYSNATVTSTYSSAGIVAYNYGLVDKCYATGNIFSSNFGAGVVGYNDGANAIVKNCVAMNNKIDVTYESQQAQQAGGYGQRILGGYKNGAPDPELNNYALKTMQVSVNNVPQKVYDDIVNGIGKSGDELVTNTTYQELGWDFNQTWSIVEAGYYPSLQNNVAAVTKPGEELEPEPDPEPVVSTTEKIVVPDIKGHTSSSISLSIDLENAATNLTAYQFDLTLPNGITLATNESGKFLVTKTSRYSDDEQSLSITKQEGNTYRFVCFSMSNSVITGTSRAILNAILDVAATVNAATHEGKISNILFTKTNGEQLKLNEAKFNITISSYILGDANADGSVNVSDIVEMVNYIMNNASSRFVKVAADVNEDGDVNVTDIVAVVNIILNAGTDNSREMTRSNAEQTDNDQLSLAVNSDNTMSLMLDNHANYVASQFDLMLSEGQQLNSITLNSNRGNSHITSYSKIANNLYRVMIYSLDNSAYTGNSGELVNINVAGGGESVIDNILFVTEGQAEKHFAMLGGNGTTGLDIINTDDVKNGVYTIDGRLVRSKTNTTSSLKKGVYIINGKKHVVK